MLRQDGNPAFRDAAGFSQKRKKNPPGPRGRRTMQWTVFPRTARQAGLYPRTDDRHGPGEGILGLTVCKKADQSMRETVIRYYCGSKHMEHKFGSAAIIGPPNAGKSTFLNQILGQKVAIVTPKPQTTRNRISGIWTGDEAQVVFLDTPGIHRLRGKMNSFMLKSAWQALAGADAAVLFLDASLYADKPHVFDKDIVPLKRELNQNRAPLIIAANKVDKVRDKRNLLGVLEKISETFPDAEIFPVAAINGDGLDELLQKVISLLPEGPPMFPEDQVSTVPMRFLAAEVVREKLFMELRQELPYQTTVEIEQWEEEDGLVRIAALIYTARKSHKGIIIGKGGASLKKIGQEARIELEDMLQCKVFLQIWVKIREGWTEDPGFLRSLGFGE